MLSCVFVFCVVVFFPLKTSSCVRTFLSSNRSSPRRETNETAKANTVKAFLKKNSVGNKTYFGLTGHAASQKQSKNHRSHRCVQPLSVFSSHSLQPSVVHPRCSCSSFLPSSSKSNMFFVQSAREAQPSLFNNRTVES